MVERTPFLDAITHLIVVLGIVALAFPVYVAFVAASLPVEDVLAQPMQLIPGDQLFANLAEAWQRGSLDRMFLNSLIVSLGVSTGKISISLLSAFAIVYFRFRFRMFAFWIIFMSLMLPVEVRIVPTYEVVANAFSPFVMILKFLGIEALLSAINGEPSTLSFRVSLLNSYPGLILPLIASATATFLFRQVFMTVPATLIEAARMDGVGPLRFLRDILIPLSRANIAALFVITFTFGWNQFLWPLLITTTDEYATIIVGLAQMMPSNEGTPEWHLTMAAALFAIVPPVLVVLAMQRQFVKGLVDVDK